MECLKLFAIILIYCSMANAVQQDCLVYNVDEEYKKQHWSGDEVTFYAFVMEDDVVNTEINYEGLEKTEYFTTLYFSPSKKYSKIIDTKDGVDHTYTLTAMPKANQWIEFKISSRDRVINVFYEPNMHEIIHMNHTAHTFSDLIIRASNRSFCEDERKWQLSIGSSETIPLGEDIAHHTFYIRINPTDHIHLNLKMDNYTETLRHPEYSLMIENTKVTLQPLTNGQKYTQSIVSQNVTKLYISSKIRKVDFSVFFLTKPPAVAHEDDCQVCSPTLSTIIILLVMAFVVLTIIIGLGLGFKCETLLVRIPEKVRSSNSKGNNGQIDKNYRDIGMTEQGNPLVNPENNNKNGDP